MLTTEIIKSLPVPTQAQCEAFVKHLVQAHSWYKHLPLLSGGTFILFLTPDAGESYPTQHPRLPTTNSVEGYRQAFGHLDYLYRMTPEEPFDRDGEEPVSLCNEIKKRGLLTVYPYISNEFYWSVHEEALNLLFEGMKHPHREAILKAYQTEINKEDYWDELSDKDTALLATLDEENLSDQDIQTLPQAIQQYLNLQNRAAEAYESLQTREIKKLETCVFSMREWLNS